MPPGGIYNSAGREYDKAAPVAWQIWYALGRSWDAQVARLRRDETGGDVLVSLLKGAAKDREKSLIVRDLQTRWSPNAEEPLAKLLSSPDAATELRNAAGWALARHGKRSYQDDLIKAYDTAPQSYRYRWLELLTWRGNKEKTGLDPRVLERGFRLLRDEDEVHKKTLKNNPDALHGGYFPACYLSDYVGAKFQPDPNDPRYQNTGRRDPRWFADTVGNALAWWEKNRRKFTEAKEADAGKGGRAGVIELFEDDAEGLLKELTNPGDAAGQGEPIVSFRIVATSLASNAVPSARKMSWNHTFGSGESFLDPHG